MSRIVTLRLDPVDALQILDAVRARLAAWQYTERYLLTGETEDGGAVEECSHADEAREIASHYEEIIRKIDRELTPAREQS